MANFFTLNLDTTGPASPTISLESGSQYATQELINATISTGDGTTTNYQMKIWGDLDLAWAKTSGIMGSGASGTAETDALWITYSTTKQLQLKANAGSSAENKTIYLKIRDDVYNESSQASDAILLDTSLPTVTISGPDVTKISEQSGKNVASFSFQVDSDFVEYKVKVVSSTGADQTTGTVIAIDNTITPAERSSVSTNASATTLADTGTFTASQVINVKIDGKDLKTASAGDGSKIIKVFVKDNAGLWSS